MIKLREVNISILTKVRPKKMFQVLRGASDNVTIIQYPSSAKRGKYLIMMSLLSSFIFKCQ